MRDGAKFGRCLQQAQSVQVITNYSWIMWPGARRGSRGPAGRANRLRLAHAPRGGRDDATAAAGRTEHDPRGLEAGEAASRAEIESGFERTRVSAAISKDEGETWTHARTLFRSHVPAVGLLDPGPVTGQVGLKSYVGELPRDYATADYPNIHFHGDEVWFHYDRNPRFIGGRLGG